MIPRTNATSVFFLRRLAGIIVLLAILTSACDRPLSYDQLEALVTRSCDRNVNHFLLDKLEHHRIVMLADQGHGYPMYLQRVISFLNFWVDTLEQSNPVGSSVPSNLILILEDDSLHLARRLQHAAAGCEVDSMQFEEFIYTNTIEFHEYYHDLVELQRRIATHNGNGVTLRPIRFQIAGAESVITDVSNWSFDELDECFIHRRDEITSAGIIRMLEEDPGAKALIFYGAGHFVRGKVLKRAKEHSAEGYFLSHYLTEKYGRDSGVYAVDQIAVNGSGATPFPCAYDSTYALDYDSLPRRQVPSVLMSGSMDGVIVDRGKFVLPTPLYAVNSQRIVNVIVSQLHRIAETRIDFFRDTWATILRYLHAISATPLEMENLRDSAVIHQLEEKWSAWHDTVHLQVVKDIDSLALYKRLVDLMRNSQRPFTSWYETMISTSAGFKPYYDTLATAEQRAADIWQYLQDNRHDIVVGNMVSLLWVGSADEKAEALQVLKRETGKDFQTAKEWTVWWRENCPTLPSI